MEGFICWSALWISFFLSPESIGVVDEQRKQRFMSMSMSMSKSMKAYWKQREKKSS